MYTRANAAHIVRSCIFIEGYDATITVAVQPGKAMTVQGDALTDRRSERGAFFVSMQECHTGR